MRIRSVDFFDDSDDSVLLARARTGDSQSADVLWIRVRPAVIAAARSIADNAHDADDLASEAMTKVFAAIADGQGPSESVLPYLHATMRNLHISGLRRQSRVGIPLELDEQRVLNLVTEEPDAVESELVKQAFKSLPDRWRHVLWASLIEGRGGAEIASELGIKPSAAHALKSRALEGLRQQYLTEHAQRSEAQECAAVHQVLASIARGRARGSTDLSQVWRHLRICEHCAEGYREITAINNRIGALLGPAAATLVGFVPQTPTNALFGGWELPAGASKALAAAGVAGLIAVTATTMEYRPEAKVTTTPAGQANLAQQSPTPPLQAKTPAPRAGAALQSPATVDPDPATPCRRTSTGEGTLTNDTVGQILPEATLRVVVPDLVAAVPPATVSCTLHDAVQKSTASVPPVTSIPGAPDLDLARNSLLDPGEAPTLASPLPGDLQPVIELAVPDLLQP